MLRWREVPSAATVPPRARIPRSTM